MPKMHHDASAASRCVLEQVARRTRVIELDRTLRRVLSQRKYEFHCQSRIAGFASLVRVVEHHFTFDDEQRALRFIERCKLALGQDLAFLRTGREVIVLDGGYPPRTAEISRLMRESGGTWAAAKPPGDPEGS